MENPSLARLLGYADAPRKPGRPRADRDADRALHIKVAWHYLMTGLTADQVARAYQINRATVHRWTNLALSYGDSEAEELRREVDEHRGLVKRSRSPATRN